VVVSNAGGAPDTSTDVTAPCTSSVICRVLILFNSMRKLLMVVVEKLGAEAETLYEPTGRLLNRYSPFAPALFCVFTPVFTLVASTLASGIAAPVLSRTVPTKSPLMTCALPREMTNSPSSATAPTTSANFLYIVFTHSSSIPKIPIDLLPRLPEELQLAVSPEGPGKTLFVVFHHRRVQSIVHFPAKMYA